MSEPEQLELLREAARLIKLAESLMMTNSWRYREWLDWYQRMPKNETIQVRE